MKIAITGGAGFVGMRLAGLLASRGNEVLILDRNLPHATPHGVIAVRTDLVHDLPLEQYLACNAVIHLAGVNIFGRWTDAYKKLIASSRIETAQALIGAVKDAGRGPTVFVSASAVGYYGDGGEEELIESSPNGTDFLAKVCREWEAVAASAAAAGMRTVSVRTGIVLGPGGGMLAKLIPIFKVGMGGPMGNGRQWFSWISLEDLLHVYEVVATDSRYSGPVNAVSPEPVRNRDFARALGKALHRPSIIPVPGFALRIVLGELGSVVLMSQKVMPRALLKNGFVFTKPAIEAAISESI